ncbi:hypothetical protein FLM53_18645 [Vibrio sp. Scap24]|nr:hypothetical protein [Vibrio sp. Scap16]QLE96083.1 hypothetical protein FLM53_18645 [Vibrio sp. Scap24]
MLVFHSKPLLHLRVSEFLDKYVNSERRLNNGFHFSQAMNLAQVVECYFYADKASCFVQRSKREAKFVTLQN